MLPTALNAVERNPTPGSKMPATRLRPGAISLSNSNHLPPISGSNVLNPVMLPPGRARLRT